MKRLAILLASAAILATSCQAFLWPEAFHHPIYYRRYGFPSRPLRHGPTPKFDKDVKDRILSFIDPFYTPTTPSYEDIRPYLNDKGINYPDLKLSHPNIIG